MSETGQDQLIRLTDTRYEAGLTSLLNGVSIEIQRGGITAIMGPNGAGKSTLLRLLAGLIVPTSGEITWQAAENLAAHTAIVFQRPVILRRSVIANIRHALAPLKLPSFEVAKRVETVLQSCTLQDLQDAPARQLSGGEQQRLAMARALARQPDILLLDEPTASLDPAATAAIERIALASAGAGTKIILVTHDAGQARRLATDIIFLHAGHAVEHTHAVEFFDQPATLFARDYLAGRIPQTDIGKT